MDTLETADEDDDMPDGATDVEALEDTAAFGVLVDALTSADGLLVTSLVVIDWGSEVMVGEAGDPPSGAPDVASCAPLGTGGVVLGGGEFTRVSWTGGVGLVGFSGLAGSITEGLEARPTPTRALASSGSIGAP